MTQNMLENSPAHREATVTESVMLKAALENVREPAPVLNENGVPETSSAIDDWLGLDDPEALDGTENAEDMPLPLVLPEATLPWQTVVNDAISRIAQSPHHNVFKILNFPNCPVAEPPLVPLASTFTPEEIEAEIGELRDPFACRALATTCRPQVMLNVAALAALVALARAIGSEEKRAEITAPGHLTLVEGADKLAMEYLDKVIEYGLCAAKTRKEEVVAFDLKPTTYKTFEIPIAADAEIQEGKPVFLIVAPGFQLPRSVAATADTRLTMGAFNTEALIYLLRLSHSTTGQIAEVAVRSLLPPDPVLAAFSGEEIVMALRKPTAVAVAHHLSTLAAKQAKPDTRFAGYPMSPELRTKAERILDDIRAYRAGQREWKDCLSGILLYGPPGVGKTDFARMIAAEAGVSLVELGPTTAHGAGYLNDAVKLLTEGFARAKASAPSLVLIDEMDAIGNRNREDRNTGYRNGLIAAFLSILDGIEGRPGVFVVGATNHRDRIDPALIRPGRFDAHLRIDLPEPDLIVPILRWHLGTELADTDLTPLISLCVGHSHAELACIVRDARATARGENRALTVADLTGLLAPGRAMPVEVRARIAIHEAGHAVARFVLTGTLPVRVMITRDGGEVHSRPVDMIMAEDFRAELAVLLAGRAAEKVLLGAPSTGAGGGAESDLAIATKLAATFEASTGLGTAGLLWLGPPEAAGDMVRRDDDLSDRVTEHLNEAEERAAKLIRERKGMVTLLARALAKAGYLGRDAIGAVLKGEEA